MPRFTKHKTGSCRLTSTSSRTLADTINANRPRDSQPETEKYVADGFVLHLEIAMDDFEASAGGSACPRDPMESCNEVIDERKLYEHESH